MLIFLTYNLFVNNNLTFNSELYKKFAENNNKYTTNENL